jgi:peroxiredoxin
MRSALLAVTTGCVTALHVTSSAPVGTEVPAFALPAQDGHRVALSDALAHGPVVLVFYRGFW